MNDKPRYRLDDRQIIEYSKIPDEQKLQWLEDALLFNVMAFTEEEKKIREIMHEIS